MTKREPKSKLQIPTRMARPKGDMFRNLRKPEEVESLSIEELTESSSSITSRGMPPSGGQTPLPLTVSIAPERDFNRRANSLERDAMPSGMFPGTSKKLYDALYLRTRGAMKPVRTIYATKKDLTLWAGIKNRKTIDAHMRYFQMIGLVRRQWVPGQNEGYQFEVLLPEELGQGDRPPVVVRPLDQSDQNLDRGSDQISGSGGQTQIVDSKTSSNASKTFKTKEERNIDDDAALADLNAALKAANKELTGKELSSTEAARWGELADVLIAELKIAAARTTVSSVPSFLAEHLRRRLWKMDKKQARAEGRELPDENVTASATSIEQAKDCPDCGGSGWWYPNGLERGVAKCKHERHNTSA